MKSLSVMLRSSPNSVQSFDSAKVINIHELAELIGRLSCIITGDWSEMLRLCWTRAGGAAGPGERRVHTSRPGLLCNRASCGTHHGLGRPRWDLRGPRFSSLPPPWRASPRDQPATPRCRPLPLYPHPSPASNAWDPGALLVAVTQSRPELGWLQNLAVASIAKLRTGVGEVGDAAQGSQQNSGRPERPVPSSAPSGPRLPGLSPLCHIPGVGAWGPSGPTHSLGRRPAAAAAPRGPLASLQAQPATPAPGCTGLIRAVRVESQEPALLLPGKAAAPPPSPSTHPLLPSQPSRASPSPLHSL